MVKFAAALHVGVQHMGVTCRECVCSLFRCESEHVQRLKWQYVRQFQLLFLMLVSMTHQR